MGKITTGTKEWATTNVNIAYGCNHDCKYCYAKGMAIRFNRDTEENWNMMIPNIKAIEKGYGKRKGRIMFPTSHDIINLDYSYVKEILVTPKNFMDNKEKVVVEKRNLLDDSILVLKKLLKAGNEVLITTKPHYDCVKKLCRKLQGYKDQVLFRFTITSLDDEVLKEWEPNAPTFSERRQALRYAFLKGWKTSVSIEPFLDKNPIPLILSIWTYVTDTMWVGLLNYKKTDFNTKEVCKKIIEEIENLPEQIRKKIRWKDSMKKIKEEMKSVNKL